MNIKEIIELLKSFQKQNIYQVYSDFVEIAAIICQKASLYYLNVDEEQLNKLEDRYLQIIAKYSQKEIQTLVRIYALFIQQIYYNYDKGVYDDILGEIYVSLNLNSKYKQQFFTPPHVSCFIGKVVHPSLSEIINKKEFISIADECCGCGGLLLKYAEVAKSEGIDPSSKLLFYAKDIDSVMAMSTYIQLNHYALPGVVDCGDTLLNTTYNRWVTLTLSMQWYKFHKFFSTEEVKDNSIVPPKVVNPVEADFELKLF